MSRKPKHFITVDGITKSLSGWARHNGVSAQVYHERLKAWGDPYRTVTEPIFKGKHFVTIDGVTKTLHGWARYHGINPRTYYFRLTRGSSLYEAVTTPKLIDRENKTPRQIATEKGEAFYEGKTHKCGYNVRYTKNCNCVYCRNG